MPETWRHKTTAVLDLSNKNKLLILSCCINQKHSGWYAVVESRRVKIFAVLGRVPDAGSVGLWLAGKHQVMAYADEPCIRDARLPK